MPPESPLFIRMMVFASAALAIHDAQSTEITAAGGHFLSDVYAKWAAGYGQATGTTLNYAAVGSTRGIEQLRKRTVTFAISAIPLKSTELKSSGLVQFPVAIGGVVLVVNIPNIQPGELVLDGPLLGKIYGGDITRWNDPRIRALNPTLSLPARPIVPIYPTGNPGTDFLFSSYVTQFGGAITDERRGSSSAGRTFRAGTASITVDKTVGALSYVEFAHAKRRKLAFTRLINREGRIVTPDTPSFQAAAANADWRRTTDYHAILTNQRGAQSWPITGVSFALMHRKVENGPAAGEALRFFDWAYYRGSAHAADSEYVPLPATLIAEVQKTWRTSIRKREHPLWLVK
jgi:phosphate transport system substrate-binding protein